MALGTWLAQRGAEGILKGARMARLALGLDSDCRVREQALGAGGLHSAARGGILQDGYCVTDKKLE